MQKGFARPGYFFIDTEGIIREKFFEAKYRERLTGNSIVAKLFPELGEEVTETVEAPHLQLALEQSDRNGVPGTRITLAAEVRLPAEASGVSAIQNDLLASNQRARPGFRGDFPNQPGRKSEFRHGLCRIARKRWENIHDHRKAGISGL
jgi:hypothetical protein